MSEIEYTCTVERGSAKPIKIKSIIMDGYVADASGNMIPVRWFYRKDGTRVEVSAFDTVFIFDPERDRSVKKRTAEANFPEKK